MSQSIKKLLLPVLIAAGSLWVSCNNTPTKPNDMEKHQHAETETIYACPMHPEVTGKKGEKCSKCGMELQAVQNRSANYQMQLSSSPERVEAGKTAKLIIALKSNDKNISLEVSHEKKLHLILVSDDLTWFSHVHPEEQPDSTLVVSETFPKGGRYLLFADYKPVAAKQNVSKAEIQVVGRSSRDDFELKKPVSKTGDYVVTLVNGNDIEAGRTNHLKIIVEKGGFRISKDDLQQYLGAVAHIVMISNADKDYIHIHPMSGKDFPIYGETSVQKPGIYRMWVQFKVGGKVHTADFTINVKPGK